MAADTPEGERFTHLYLERGEAAQDSPRMRRRIAALVHSIDDLAGLSQEIESELGVSVPHTGYRYDWHRFFETCELRDLLDTVTVAWRHLDAKRRPGMQATATQRRLPSEVERIFAEENVRYRVDSYGGVHFAVDEEFERNRAASIAVLGRPRYANVLHEFEECYARLADTPPNGKAAIRAVFSAAEGLFRLMFEAAPRLSAKDIDTHLVPFVQKSHAGDAVASRAASKLINGFKDWVDAAHFYRHEPGKEGIAQPPLSLAVNIVSQGATFIRWLAEMDSGA